MENIKSQQGITLVALVITIVLMLILTSVTVYTGIDSYKNAQVTRFISQMQLIQEKVDNIKKEDGLLLGDAASEEQKLSISSIIDKEDLIKCDETENPFSNWRYFSKKNLLSDLDLEEINGDIFINFQTREVISLTGVYYTKDKKTHHTQYSLLGGQALIQNEGINLSKFTLKSYSEQLKVLVNDSISNNINITGLNARILIPTIYYGETKATNPVVKYKKLNKDYNTYIMWLYPERDHNIDYINTYNNINNDEKNKNAWNIVKYNSIEPNYIDISEPGEYIFAISDKNETSIYLESIKIVLCNSIKEYDICDLTGEKIENYYYDDGAGGAHINAFVKIEDEIYAWIPRYAYNIDLKPQLLIDSYGHITTSEMNEWIKYLKGNSNITTYNQLIDEKNNNDWVIPKQFEDEESGKQYSGLLVKYDSSIVYSLDDLDKKAGGFWPLVGILIGENAVSAEDIIPVE